MSSSLGNKRSDASFLGTGWSFPPTFDKGDHSVRMSSAKHNIKQSIDLVLQTVCGDRSMNPSFGSELSHCVFRNLDPSLEAEIVGKVQTSLLNFEPRIKVEQVTIIANQGQDNIVTIDIGIAYQIKMTNSRDNHIYPFYLNEATNLQTKQG